MKKTTFFFALLLFTLNGNAQTFKRNPKESMDDFARRVFPADASMQLNPIENKFGTPLKKIIFFSKKLAMDTTINKTDKVDCLFVNVLIPENETYLNYTLQTLLIDCNRNYNVQIEDAFPTKNKSKGPVLSIMFCQLNQHSKRVLVKNFKTFNLRQLPDNTFTIEKQEN